MKKVNSISGGKTSSYIAAKYPACYEVFSLVCIDDKRCAPKDPSIIQYVNDKLNKFTSEFGEFIATAEDDKTLIVMRDLEQYIGREITWVRGVSFDDVIDKGTQARLPSWARRYCTEQMKLRPIFKWWFNEIGEKCEMRIGFRFDEFSRLENFFNNSDPTNFSIPVRCKTYGQRRQVNQSFNWRKCTFPLIKDGIDTQMIADYWRGKFVGGDLFDEQRYFDFPVVSNCVGCFHKKPETIGAMCGLHPQKMNWFAEQETKGMGTWLDSRITYAEIMNHAKQNPYPEEQINNIISCDSGGCTD